MKVLKFDKISENKVLSTGSNDLETLSSLSWTVYNNLVPTVARTLVAKAWECKLMP